jgi:hypothetical protein
MKQIVAIDGNAGKSGWISWIMNGFKGELDKEYEVVVVNSVKDMVEKVINAAGGDKISRLFIEGHGASGFQCVGCGFIENALKNKDKADYLEFSELEQKLKNGVEDSLKRLIPKLDKWAVVSLGGCQVGSAPFGEQLLKRISKVLGGVSVEAGTIDQRPFFFGYEGSVVRCNETFCLTMQPSWTY